MTGTMPARMAGNIFLLPTNASAQSVSPLGGFKLRVSVILLAILLTACDGPQEDNAYVQTESTGESEPALYLSCTGTTELPLESRQDTKVFRVPTPDSGEQLSYYNEDEKLFWETCASATHECSTRVDEDIIRQDGVGRDGLDSFITVVINRRTGSIQEQFRLSQSVISSFDGTCERTTAPAPQPAKF